MDSAGSRLIGSRLGAVVLRRLPVAPVRVVVITKTGTVVPDAANGMM
ncbi:MAG: hypothetical protein QGF21_13690 [Vicinamibacterales bacterium]|jgi:hypothetical protein|nr:hypothetical protein [Vicinamibacterales bacterium]MDP7672983.1 hypothetical protein [Vicinamibacterales bacterium]HJO37260.1 hypothetical protein [Vicinamibacterales bacterium]|tara:strand:+ start:191 stop:331 length:141 start_codon:yes stop_codon:yes gene_type:complete